MTTPAEGPADTPAAPSTEAHESLSRKRSRTAPAAQDAPAAVSPTSTIQSTSRALRDTLLDPSHVDKLHRAYPQSPGYPHCVVQDVLDPAFFRGLREEMVGSLSATFKETDLFKLYQTGDLANLDDSDPEIISRLPHLLALRQAIYSPPFRAFVREITGCQPLTDRTDCSSNLYAQGCHLLCHDDVIGTRCISFIIYLTDPDEAWEAADGGALEIYPLSEPGKLGAPAVVPIQNHLPLPNTMAFFTVLPGQSFHAVEEVYMEGKMRLSISGWYHAAAPPAGAQELASLNQLQTRQDKDDVTVLQLPPLSLTPSLSTPAAERNPLLARWVNPTYLKAGAMEQILERFQEDGSVLLHGFLLPEISQRAATLLRAQDQAEGMGRGVKPAYDVGYVGGEWEAVGPPHKQRYLRLAGGAVAAAAAAKKKEDEEEEEEEREVVNEKANDKRDNFTTTTTSSSGNTSCSSNSSNATTTTTSRSGNTSNSSAVASFLASLRDELFGSAAFAHYLARLTGVQPTAVSTEARRFRPGLDYTLAHYGILTKDPRLDASLSFVDDGEKTRKEAWESGDVGGFGCYIKAEEGNDGAEAAESYRRQAREKDEGEEKEEEEDVLSVFAAHNALSLVLRQRQAMRFVKYVSAAAPGSRWDVISEYWLEKEEDKEEEEEERGREEEEKEGGVDAGTGKRRNG